MLEVKSVSFSYSDKITLNAVDFVLQKGKILGLIGESGCGKSTLLKLIYGLHDTDQGEILWNNNLVLGPKNCLVPGMDSMKYLAQDFDLMPYISVAENVGKYLSNVNLVKKQNRINELLEVVEMTDFANTKAKNLSGGQMQRVALAKALALKPEVLLLDEPFSHIDNFRKNDLRRSLFAYVKRNEITTIVASHESDDVLSFANELLVFKNGSILQHDSVDAVYNFPTNKYVASLFGDANEINAVFFDEQNTATPKIVYAHQLMRVPISKLKVIVANCYFKGSYYLVECSYENGILYFQNDTVLPNNTVLFLSKKPQH